MHALKKLTQCVNTLKN